MDVPERDWLLLRARLRAFASAVVLPVFVASASGCAAEEEDEEDSVHTHAENE